MITTPNPSARTGEPQLQSGDLVFSSNPNEHVGLYVGAGMMVAATHTGDFVRYQALYSNITLAARPG
jgi:cell wall-associated NlpC family hydrolase